MALDLAKCKNGSLQIECALETCAPCKQVIRFLSILSNKPVLFVVIFTKDLEAYIDEVIPVHCPSGNMLLPLFVLFRSN